MKSFLRLTQILVLISLSSSASAQVQRNPDALAQLISAQNSQIHRQIDSRTSVGIGALARNDPLRTMVRQRAEYLKQLIEADPGRALTLRLSDDVRRRLLTQSSDLEDAVEEFGSWNGPADVVIEDRFDLGTSRTLVRVQDPSGELDVFFKQAVPDLVCGQQVGVEGMRVGDVIAATAATAGDRRAHEKGAQVGCESTIGTHNIVVVLIEFPDQSLPGDRSLPGFVTQDWVQDRMFSTVDRSLHGFWAENSSGLAGGAGDIDDVYGPIQIAATCNTNTIRNTAVAAVDGNVDFSSYTRLFIIFPESACGFLGLGSIGCSSVSTNDCGGSSCPMGLSWMTIDSNNDNRSYLAAFGSHEGGHNYRLRHASSFEYGNQPLGDLDEAGVHCEYGDVFSTMGVLYGSNPITGHYGVQHKVQLGWLALGLGYQVVIAPGTFLLQPVETSSGLRALRILRDPGSDLWLWLEYRQPLGDYDPRVFLFSSSAFSGALAHYQYSGLAGGPFSNDGRTRLLDFQPGFPTAVPDNQCVQSIGSDDMRQVTLLPGVLWTDPDPNSELSLLVNSADQNGLSVTITYGGAPVPQPDLIVDALTGPATGTIGDSINVSATVENQAAAAGAFDLAFYFSADGVFDLGDTPSATTCSYAGLAAGASDGATCNNVAVAVPASLTAGTYTLFAQVDDLDAVGESDETNNTRAADSGTISLAPPGGLIPPTNVSVSPSAGSGSQQVFTFTYQDAEGAGDIAFAQFNFSSVLSPSNACYVHYNPGADAFSLLNDDASGWLGPIAAGSAGVISNSQCIVNASGSGATQSGQELEVVADLTFLSGFVGLKGIHLFVGDQGGNRDGWDLLGNWTVEAASGLPELISLAPAAGSGATQVFTVTVRDGDGAADFAWVQLNMNATLNALNACYIHHDPTSNFFALLNDDATAWNGVTGGSGNMVANSQCTLRGAGSGRTLLGTDLVVTFDLTFDPSFAGAQLVHVQAADQQGNQFPWQLAGNWTVEAASGLPELISLAPAAGSGATQVFTVTVRDGDGAADFAWVQLNMNATLNALNACYIHHDPTSNFFALLNDDATAWNGVTGGSGNMVANSQCTLRGAGSGRTLLGTDLVVTFDLTFDPSFAGAQLVHVQAADQQGNQFPWQLAGNWTVP